MTDSTPEPQSSVPPDLEPVGSGKGDLWKSEIDGRLDNIEGWLQAIFWIALVILILTALEILKIV
ncbi:MAG TPA: hypothetical protein VML94_08115 [Thermoplasmata archaeon]|nr:hypothetical protein [Thermoplasmata archaeon]